MNTNPKPTPFNAELLTVIDTMPPEMREMVASILIWTSNNSELCAAIWGAGAVLIVLWFMHPDVRRDWF